MSDTDLATRIASERNDATRAALSRVLLEIDGLQGNELYRRAWKRVSVVVQGMLKGVETVNMRP